MLSHQLQAALAPFNLLVSRNALNPIYRAIEIGPDGIRACISWGIIELPLPMIQTNPVYVDRATFLAVVKSLPKDRDFTLTEDGTSLVWTCGNARGRLALMAAMPMPAIDWTGIEYITVPLGLAKAMELGSIACHTTALAAIGMFGIVIDQRGTLCVCSTDNTSMSTALVEGAVLPGYHGLPGAADVSTLPPDGVELLSKVIQPGGVIGFDDKAWYYADDTTYCKIVLLPPMKSDTLTVREKYLDANIVVVLPRAAIEAFIKRANALAEVKRNATVNLSTVDRRLVLRFNEGSSTTEEYFLVDSLVELPPMPEISLNATKLARALAHVDEVALDHIERGVLLFRGPGFDYLLCGKLVPNNAKDVQ